MQFRGRGTARALGGDDRRGNGPSPHEGARLDRDTASTERWRLVVDKGRPRSRGCSRWPVTAERAPPRGPARTAPATAPDVRSVIERVLPVRWRRRRRCLRAAERRPAGRGRRARRSAARGAAAPSCSAAGHLLGTPGDGCGSMASASSWPPRRFRAERWWARKRARVARGVPGRRCAGGRRARVRRRGAGPCRGGEPAGGSPTTPWLVPADEEAGGYARHYVVATRLDQHPHTQRRHDGAQLPFRSTARTASDRRRALRPGAPGRGGPYAPRWGSR
jgi:hypothetical protein